MQEILKLLETLERKKLVGTLVLGRKRRSLEVFLEENLLYLPPTSYQGKIDIEVLVETGILGTKVSETAIETIALASDLTRTILPEVLYSRGLIDQEELGTLARHQFQEELFNRLLIYKDSFHFQEDHVPESIIGQETLTTKVPILLDQFLEILRTRLIQLSTISEVIPTHEEIFVITEKGMARKQQALSDFPFQRIFDLLDGFRTLQSILNDGFFFPFYVSRRIVEALENGWIKKTLTAELRNVDPSQLTREDAERYLPYFKNAVRFSVDEIKARENLALLLRRLGKADQAVIQYNFIGDTQYQMGRKARAVQAYQQGLAIRPTDPLITEKIVRIYREGAEEAVNQKQFSEAITLYRNALQIIPNNPDIFRALIKLHIAKKEMGEISNLCDQITTRDRLGRDADFAIEIVTSVVEQFPQEPAFHKKLINIFLTTGRTAEAAEEMEKLAVLLHKDGKIAQLPELVEKILRIDPRRKHLRRLIRPRNKGPLINLSGFVPKNLLVRVILLLLLGVFIYQLWAYRALDPVRNQRYLAFATSDWKKPEEGNEIIESNLERQLQFLIECAVIYQRYYPISLFRWEARRLEKEFRSSAQRLAKTRSHFKESLIRAGKAEFRRGNTVEAEKALQRLMVCPSEDSFRKEAEKNLEEIQTYEFRAALLLQDAAKARNDGKRSEAYRLLKRLLDEYPLSQSIKHISFPVDLTTIPEGTTARVRGGPECRTPCQFNITPGQSEEVLIEKPGFESVTIRLTPSEGPAKAVMLRQNALWQRALPAAGARLFLIDDGVAIYLSESGLLTALLLQSGETIWEHALATKISPAASPLTAGGRLLIPLNTGQILRFHPRSGLEASHQLEGLFSSSLVEAPGGKTVYYGSTRNQIVEFDFTSNTIVRTLDLRDTPQLIAPGKAGQAYILGASRVLYGVDLAAQKIIWKSPIRESIAAPPVFMQNADAPVLMVLTEAQQLIAIDPLNGRIHWRRGPASKTSEKILAAILPQSGRILVSEGRQVLLEIEPLGGKELRRWSDLEALQTCERIEELPQGLSAFKSDGSLSILDPLTLQPRWGYGREGQSIQSAAARQNRLLLTASTGAVYCLEPILR